MAAVCRSLTGGKLLLTKGTETDEESGQRFPEEWWVKGPVIKLWCLTCLQEARGRDPGEPGALRWSAGSQEAENGTMNEGFLPTAAVQ